MMGIKSKRVKFDFAPAKLITVVAGLTPGLIRESLVINRGGGRSGVMTLPLEINSGPPKRSISDMSANAKRYVEDMTKDEASKDHGMTPDRRKTMGKVAFDAYNKARGGKTHDGQPTPPWEELGDGVRAGWMAAARAVEQAVKGEVAAKGRPAPGDDSAGPRCRLCGRHG